VFGNKNEEERKFILKLLLLGDLAVGKTSLINRYVQGKFSEDERELCLSMMSLGNPLLTVSRINGTLILKNTQKEMG